MSFFVVLGTGGAEKIYSHLVVLAQMDSRCSAVRCGAVWCGAAIQVFLLVPTRVEYLTPRRGLLYLVLRLGHVESL